MPAGYNEWRIQWAPENPETVFWILALLIPLAMWFSGSGVSRVPTRARRWLILSLRALSLTLLALVILHPQVEMKQSDVMKNTIAVLLDDSLSLSIQGGGGGRRADLVRADVGARRQRFDELRKDYEVEFYYFSDDLIPARQEDLSETYRPGKPRTDFAQVFRKLKEAYAGRSLQGVVLYSDGADLTQDSREISPELAGIVAGLKAPVHALQAGTNEGFRDVGIESIDAPDFGFVFQPFKIKVTLTASGAGRTNVPLVLREGDRILASRQLAVSPEKNRYEAEFEITPSPVGKHIYHVTTPLLAGESIAENNHQDFQVNVVRDRLRVLQLTGRPSWDSRFLREVLAQNPKVDLLSFFILRTLSDDVGATTGELSLIPFPSNLLFSDYLGSFDLVIFQNFQYAPFMEKKNLDNIGKYVENGGGFLMVGGDLSFQAGGYSNTAVESVLPVRFQNPALEVLTDEFRLKPGAKLWRHPLLRLEKDAALNRAAWDSLPPLNGLNGGLAPAAKSLVVASHARGKEEHPVLVLGRRGKGRSMAIATDSLWNWNFRRVGEGGSGRYYQTFWNNVIAWLTRDPDMHPVRVETDREKYRAEEKAVVHYRIARQDFSPVANGEATLILRSVLTGRELLREKVKAGEEGEGAFEYTAPGEGFYSARIEAAVDGETAADETRFQVFTDMAEYQKPLVNPELMQSLARISGGEYRVLGDASPAPLIFPNPVVKRDTRKLTIGLWDNWWSYGLILASLGLDWWLRRRAGLS